MGLRAVPVILIHLFVALVLYPQEIHDTALLEKAGEISQKYIILDAHIDLPMQMYNHRIDPSGKSSANCDYYKSQKGGLDVPFMSIYIPARYQGTAMAQVVADSTITLVEKLAENHSDKFALVAYSGDIYNNFKKGLISLPMGMENGAPVTDFTLLKHFYDRGIRYITLTHSKDNHIGDSSYDTRHTNNGLTEFGKQLVKEMNKIGMMIDISHVSDKTFYDVMNISETPVIASHSSCRYFTPGFERNMSDEMIEKLAEKGGVIQINFGAEFISQEFKEQENKFTQSRAAFMKNNNMDVNVAEVQEFTKQYWNENPKIFPGVSGVVDHIDHVVNLVGVDFVGIGSDFDGVNDILPTGLKDVSMFPSLIYEMLKRGYFEKDIEKILSGNFMRVWKEVETFAELN